MFTGIVEEIGSVACFSADRLSLRAARVLEGTELGHSIAVNGVHVGETPVDFRETTGWEKRYDVEITKPGYEPVKDVFRQSEWDARIAVPSVAGAFCLLPLAGLLFSRRARHGYHWKLTPGGGAPPAGPAEGPQAPKW